MIDHVSSALGPRLGASRGREQAVRTDGGTAGYSKQDQRKPEEGFPLFF